jgi:hypothetical protein
MATFKPGQVGNPRGRPKGSKHRLSEAFIRAIADDFEAHGVSVVQAVRADDPATYLRIVAGLMPKELVLTDERSLNTLTDDELADIARGGGVRNTEAESGAAQPDAVH